MKPIDPQIVDVDLDSPMSEEEIKKLKELEGILRKSFLETSKIEWKIGGDLSKVKALGDWKKDECFIVKTGKNKGKFEKKPKFDKWLKWCIEKYSFQAYEWQELRDLVKQYELKMRNKKWHEEQLEKLKREEEINEQ